MKLRLLVDAHVFDREYQGTRTFIQGIYNALCKKSDIELFLAAGDPENLKNHFPSQENIHLIELKSKSAWRRLVFEIPSLIKQHGIEYAHFQYIVPLIKNCRFIVTTHDVIFNEYPQEFSMSYRTRKNFLYRTSAHRADIITTVSEYSKNSIQKFLHIEANDIHVIPNGVSPSYFQPYNKSSSREYIRKKYGFSKFILYVSRMEPRKNHSSLLKAFVELGLFSNGYHLVFLGNKTLHHSEFERLIQELPESVKHFVFISDEVDNNELLEFYRAADLFVYPSKAEGFGIPPLEAAALKIPVICSNSSAMSEYSFFRKNHINPNDSEKLKERIVAELKGETSQTFLNQLSVMIAEKYNWSRSAELLCDLIVKDKALFLPANQLK